MEQDNASKYGLFQGVSEARKRGIKRRIRNEYQYCTGIWKDVKRDQSRHIRKARKAEAKRNLAVQKSLNFSPFIFGIDSIISIVFLIARLPRYMQRLPLCDMVQITAILTKHPANVQEPERLFLLLLLLLPFFVCMNSEFEHKWEVFQKLNV